MISLAALPLRFGDPVLAISTTNKYLAYGTAYGRVILYDLFSQEYQQIVEISEEYISSIKVTENSHLYFAIGDFYCAEVGPFTKDSRPKLSHYNKVHTVDDCGNSVTFIHMDTCCLIPTNGGNIYLLNFTQQNSIIYDPLPPSTIPLDYYNEKILTLQYKSTGVRCYSHFCFKTGIIEEIISIGKEHGHITGVKMYRDGIVFIQNFKSLNLYRYDENDTQNVFEIKADILSYGLCELDDAIWCGIIDKRSNLTVLKNWEWVCEGVLEYEGEKVQDFNYGYPYLLVVHPPYLSVTSDTFVYVLEITSK